MILTVLLFTALIFGATEGLSKKCKNPKFCTALQQPESDLFIFTCNEDFEMMGDSNATCNTQTRKYNGNPYCAPKIVNGVMTCTLKKDACPKDLRYLMSLELDATEDEFRDAEMEVELAGRSLDGCRRLCTHGANAFRYCAILKGDKRRRRKRKSRECWDCVKRTCYGLSFWG